MPTIEDQDRFFSGNHDSSTPKHLIPEGSLSRLINGRFVEGAITNALGFDLLEFKYAGNENSIVPKSAINYKDLMAFGEIQLVAPMRNPHGSFLVLVVSKTLLLLDIATKVFYDITPQNAFLKESGYPLSFLDNDGYTYGLGGYVVIFNYPNRPIFVESNNARISVASLYEMPPSRLGASSGNRVFTIAEKNLFYASDNLTSIVGTTPLTYRETISKTGTYNGQIFTVGSSLDVECVTNVTRMPRLLGAAQDFLGHNLLLSTQYKKYIVPVASPRETWGEGGTPFITYAGTSEAIAGGSSSTNVGSSVVYISSSGRIKTYSQDVDRENSLSETYFDEGLGQFMNEDESNYHFRSWYRNLDHSHSHVKFHKDRLYATVYPYKTRGLNKSGDFIDTPTNRALAVGSLDSTSLIGAQASLSWEGFLDWLNPVSLTTLDDLFFVVAKDKYGINKIYKENLEKLDEHRTIVYTRGFFSNVASLSKSILKCYLYFRVLSGSICIKISCLIDDEWLYLDECTTDNKLVMFTFSRMKCKTNSWSIPLKIEIFHDGCRFELESIRVSGESHKNESR